MDAKLERMAALGALGVCAGVLATYGAIAWFGLTTPFGGAPRATGGMDAITRNVLWIAALVPTLLFVATHLAFARQLIRGPRTMNE